MKAKFTGMESYKVKVLCRNLSSEGHGSQGGHGLFLLFLLSAKGSSSDSHRLSLLGLSWGVLFVPPLLCHLTRFAIRGNQSPSSCGVVFSFQAPEGGGMQTGLSPAPESRLCSQNSF